MFELKRLMLQEPRLTLAVAESVTCGRIQVRIGLIAGASSFFHGGITTYNLEQKMRHLGVSKETAEPVNSVSMEVAEQMARGACVFFGAKLGLATTGFAEPDVKRANPVPFAWWALAHDLGDGRTALQSGMVECPGLSRAVAQEAIATAATRALLQYLHQFRGR
ncbi:MAG: nicotinamide-nucleotide amidohydrolase family protein [Opitutaceae bacterium]|jgi:nicotinamide-nucleotide amidase